MGLEDLHPKEFPGAAAVFQAPHSESHSSPLSCLLIERDEQREETWSLISLALLQRSPWVRASATLPSPALHWGQINLPTAQL